MKKRKKRKYNIIYWLLNYKNLETELEEYELDSEYTNLKIEDLKKSVENKNLIIQKQLESIEDLKTLKSNLKKEGLLK